MILLLVVSVRGNADGILLGDMNYDRRISVADMALLVSQMEYGNKTCISSDISLGKMQI